MNDPPVVLLVDDEPRILSALRRTLRRVLGDAFLMRASSSTPERPGIF